VTTTELREWQFNGAVDGVANVVSRLYQTIYASGEGDSFKFPTVFLLTLFRHPYHSFEIVMCVHLRCIQGCQAWYTLHYVAVIMSGGLSICTAAPCMCFSGLSRASFYASDCVCKCMCLCTVINRICTFHLLIFLFALQYMYGWIWCYMCIAPNCMLLCSSLCILGYYAEIGGLSVIGAGYYNWQLFLRFVLVLILQMYPNLLLVPVFFFLP